MPVLSQWIQKISVLSDPTGMLQRTFQSRQEVVPTSEQLALVRRCLAQKADPNRVGTSSVSVLSMLVDQFRDSRAATPEDGANRLAMLDALLAAGANPHAPRMSDGRSPMHQAICNGPLEVVERLAQHGGDPLVPCKGRSALHLCNDPVIAQWLLDHGADPDALFDGQTPLHYAQRSAQALIDHESMHATFHHQAQAKVNVLASALHGQAAPASGGGTGSVVVRVPELAQRHLAVARVLEQHALRQVLRAVAEDTVDQGLSPESVEPARARARL